MKVSSESMYTLYMLFSFPIIFGVGNNKLLGADKSEYHKDHVKYMRNIGSRHSCSKNGADVCMKPAKLSRRCWGYEEGCVKEYMFQYPVCKKHINGRWAEAEKYIHHYWKQGGFGYVKEKKDSINIICEAKEQGDSFFRCSKEWEFCEAGNLYMDLRKVKFSPNLESFKKDFFSGNGDIGGVCELNKDLLDKPIKYNDELRSWNAELRFYSSLQKKIFKKSKCDEFINTTTIFMKLDAGVNMYHHFCNFLNLYATQHILADFSKDVNIIYWDTSTYRYQDYFSETWNVFTKNSRRSLYDLRGKRICFKHAVFSLLPRMIHGLYYNTPLMAGCHGGGVLRAFSEHVLHRLGISQNQHDGDVVRVTLLKRSTQYRVILNENELVAALKNIPKVNITVVDYKYPDVPFLEQLRLTHNSDVLIGMHGAGLTHAIFLPNWGAVFELYNTGDVHCYEDLSRLRGLSYFTWEREELIKGRIDEKYNNNPKFANYKFDVNEFVRIVTRTIKVVELKRPERRKK